MGNKLNVWVDMSCIIFGLYDLGNRGCVCGYEVSSQIFVNRTDWQKSIINFPPKYRAYQIIKNISRRH